MQNKTWTQDEIDYLCEKWGVQSGTSIAKHLGRSVNAVKVKVQRLHLGAFSAGGGYVSLLELMQAIGGKRHSHCYSLMRLIEAGLPYRKKKIWNQSIKVISIDDFWKWAQEHQKLLDFSHFEEGALGAEPAWVRKKRRIDTACTIPKRKWTPEEDDHLKAMLREHRYNFKQLAAALNRSEPAIKRRIYDLKLKDWPVRQKPLDWTEKEIEILCRLIGEGYSYEYAAKTLHRTASACRGKYENIVKKRSEHVQ